MKLRLFPLPVTLWIVSVISSCLPFPYPASEVDRDDQDLHTAGMFDYVANRDEVTGLLERSASREEVIATLGRPMRYRQDYVTYEACRTKGGLGVIVGMPPYLLPYNIAGGGLDCVELLLELDDQNRLISILERSKQGEVDEQSEDLLLREYGQQGDLVAQSLWQKSRTYYTSQDVDIVRERTERQIWRNEKSKEIASELMSRAEDGDPEAQFHLYLLEDRKPLKWLCRAADQNYLEAQIQLGYLYGSGAFGISQDYDKSYMWYRLAASGELCEAVDKEIERIEKKSFWTSSCSKGQACYIAKRIVELRNMLGKDGLSKAEKLVLDWKPGQCESELHY